MNLLQVSTSAGILILGIVLFRSLMLYRIPKKILVLLWVIVIVRLLVPFYIPSAIPGIGNMVLRNEKAADSSKNEWKDSSVIQQNEILQNAADENVTEEKEIVDWYNSGVPENLILYLWVAGVIICLAGLCTSFRKDIKILREALPTEIPGKTAMAPYVRGRKVKVLVSDRIITPLTYGVIRTRIILPKTMKQADETALTYVICHEMIHIRHYDNLWKLISLLAACIHWFNPLVWVMIILFNRDLELRCDENVLRLCGNGSQKSYALTLISLAEQKSRGFLTGMGFGRNAVKERLEAIMKNKKLTIIGAVAAVAVIAAALTVFVKESVSRDNADSGSISEEAYEVADTGGMDNAANVEYAGTTKSREEMYAPYEAAGAVYDKESDRIYIGDIKIKQLLDKKMELIYSVPEGEGSYRVIYNGEQVKEIEEISNEKAVKLKKEIENKKSFVEYVPLPNHSDKSDGYIFIPKKDAAEYGSKDIIEETAKDAVISASTNQTIEKFTEEFAEYGLSVKLNDTDWQFYYNDEPVYFVADNHAIDGTFSGQLYSKEQGTQNGTCGVVVIRDGSGKATGLTMLSEEDSIEYSKGWNGKS